MAEGEDRERNAARRLLTALRPRDAEQASLKDQILAFLDAHADALLRTCPPGHLTASCLLVDAAGRRVLLHHHRKLSRWLQFGGHVDGEGDLRAAARRELVEESGIEPIWLADAPFDLDIHEIPAHGEEPAHLHLDVRYLARADRQAEPKVSAESKALAWFTRTETLALDLDPSLRRMIELVLKD